MNPPPSSVGPQVVGVGIDLADVARLQAALGRRQALVARLFTTAERPIVERSAAAVVAQRFAAKEAVMKSLGIGVDSVAFTDIELDEHLRTVTLSGRALQRASDVGADTFEVQVGVVEGPEGDVATAEVVASSTVS